MATSTLVNGEGLKTVFTTSPDEAKYDLDFSLLTSSLSALDDGADLLALYDASATANKAISVADFKAAVRKSDTDYAIDIDTDNNETTRVERRRQSYNKAGSGCKRCSDHQQEQRHETLAVWGTRRNLRRDVCWERGSELVELYNS